MPRTYDTVKKTPFADDDLGTGIKGGTLRQQLTALWAAYAALKAAAGQGGTQPTALGIPANLRQTASTSSSVTFSWDAVANATGYRLRVNGSTLYMPTTTSYTLTGLPAGSSVSAEVQALGDGITYATGSYSPTVTATTQAAGPVVLTPQASNHSQNGGIDELQSDGRHRHASFAVLEAAINASTVDISVLATASNRSVSVLLDGVVIQTLTNSALGTQTFTVALTGTGLRRLKLIEGHQDRDFEQGDILGTTVTKLVFPAGSTAAFVVSSFSQALIVYGDSISNGAVTDTRQLQGWAPLLRSAARGVTVDGYGSHTATVALGTATARAAALAHATAAFQGATRKQAWLALGTNDFGFGAASPTDVGAYVAAFVDALHSQDSTIGIFVQTPIVRTDSASQSANPLGFTLQQYRDALTALGSTRAWLRVVDGLQLVTAAQLVDGLHPGVAGHADYSAKVAKIIGNIGLPADINWSRIVAADNATTDYVSGQPALTVPAGRGTPAIVANALAARAGYDFVRSDNDAYRLDTSTASQASYLVAAVVNIRSYENGQGMLLSGLNGAGEDVFWSLGQGSHLHVQGKEVAATVPVGLASSVVYFITPAGQTCVRINGTTYTSTTSATAGDARGIASVQLGVFQGGAGWAIDGHVYALAMAPGQFTEAQAIAVEKSLRDYYGL